MNKKKKDELKFRKFNFKQTPTCKWMRRRKLSNGQVIEVCLVKKGVGRNGFICAFAGQNPKCKYYECKHKWGRSLMDLAGDFLGGNKV